MTTQTALISFTLAAALLTVTPGLDTALVLRTAAVEGRRSAYAAAMGICLGVLVWGVIVALGLGALLAASQRAYDVLRWTGAAYLLYLGIGMIVRPRSSFSASDASMSERNGKRNWFVRGILTNLLNPKVGVFYVSFLPQFIPARQNVPLFTVGLAGIHSLEGILWFALLIAATQPAIGALRRPGMMKALDRLTGTILIGFGIRLVAEARR